MRLARPLLLAACAVAATVVLAQPQPDSGRFSPPLNPANYVPLGVSGASAWYLDLSTQKVIVCTKGSSLNCEAAPIPR